MPKLLPKQDDLITKFWGNTNMLGGSEWRRCFLTRLISNHNEVKSDFEISGCVFPARQCQPVQLRWLLKKSLAQSL